MIFPNFLIPKLLILLSRSATRVTARIYQYVTNNHASFHLWWKENLLNHQKVSKYYEHDCRSWHEQKISKCKMRLTVIMLICIKQNLRTIWSSFYEKVKQHGGWVEKSVPCKKNVKKVKNSEQNTELPPLQNRRKII